MAEPRTPIAGRYAYLGSLKTSQGAARWVGTELESGRRVVLAALDASRLTTLDSAKGIKHRHLTSVLDVVREVDPSSVPGGRALAPGFGVVVAEFVPGKTLHGELGRAGMNPSKAVAWALRLADALQALHAAGAVHAALSPRSVVAVPEGRAIAPVLSQLVAPALGAYCPPERLKGSSESAPDDVWALHAVLYAALTRQAPYAAASRDALLKQMLSGRPKPLSSFGIDDPALQEILDRGLAYERRVRVTDLSEVVETLDAWERDPAAMPAKRQVAPRPATRSLMDIVGATGVKGRDDAIVIDASALPDDEGSELDPRPATPAPSIAAAPPLPSSPTPSPPAVSAPLVASAPLPPVREALSSAPTFAASVLPGSGEAVPPVRKRVSINPFERKRSVWPLVLVAAIAGGGGVYLAVAPDAPAPTVKATEPAPAAAAPAKPAAPERPKLSASEARDSCVASYFDDGTFEAKPEFAFLCGDGDFRELAARLQRIAHPPGATDAGLADGGARGSALDWYELPAAAVIRKSCCESAAPVVLPETPGWCEQLQTVVRRIADNSGKAGDLAPDARSFDKAVACLFANKVRGVYAYEKAPSDANRQAFQQFLSRAAISEARR